MQIPGAGYHARAKRFVAVLQLSLLTQPRNPKHLCLLGYAKSCVILAELGGYIPVTQFLQNFDVSVNPGLREAVPLLLSAARKRISFSQIPIDDQKLLEMAQVLQSNTSLIKLHMESDFEMSYTFESLTKFVEIVTAPESKSRLEFLKFGQHKENKDITLLSYQLTHMAASRGHKLEVHPFCLDTELYSLIMEQYSKADRMPDSLLYAPKKIFMIIINSVFLLLITIFIFKLPTCICIILP